MTVITVGDRLRLVRTNYRDSSKTELQRGDQGVITDITELPVQLGGKKQF
jgi:hypothetical protein